MENQFVSYELSVKLKELGFDDKCLGFYTELENIVIKEGVKQHDCVGDKCSAPLWQQAFDWFREQHLLFGAAQYDHIRNDLSYYIVWGNMGECCDAE